MPKILLGIDSGCTMSKAALFTLDGREVAVASRKTETVSPAPGHQERDTAGVWRATAEAVREVLARSGIAPADVACVACAGHGNGLYLVNKQGQPVRPAILSTDLRAAAISQAWNADGTARRLRPLTMQAVWPAQPGALLAWLLKHEPRAMDRAGWVLMCKDYIRFRLTGRIQAELTDMSGTGLMNVGTGAYDNAVLAAQGLEAVRDMLPPLVRTADIVGTVTAQAAAETGLAPGTPVAGGMFDIDACGLATGLVSEQQLCMIAGTWGNNQYISRKPVVDEDVFMTSCYSIPGYYLMLEGSATSASNLEWFVTEFFGAEKEKAAAAGRSVYDLCNDLVAASRDNAGVVFLPYLYGSNANPAAKASLVGMAGWHARGDVLRAIYEGVVFGHRWHVQRLLKFRPPPEVISLTGGGARSAVWVQIYADAFQTPVQIPDGTELGALGACIAAGVAAGVYKDYAEAIGAMVRFSRRQEPDPSRAGLYAAKYERWLKTIDALDPLWGDGA
jgi:L-xylulokinase